MSRRLLIPALFCAIPILAPACGGGTAGTSGAGGAKTGGSTTASGGNTTSTGGAAAGGATTAAGGTTISAGGTTTAAGGTTTALGGSTTSSGGARTGGATGGGGATTASGGSTTASGGATTATGGKISATGGTTTGSGGATAATGGATVATGGALGTGGATSPGTGGATGMGGATGAGGSTGGGLEVWISPTGNDDTGTGTKDSPLFSICWDQKDPEVKKGGCYKLCPLGVGCNAAGGTIWVMDGTYKYTVTQKIGTSKLGTASGQFKVMAVDGAKPVFDFSAMAVGEDNRGIQLGGDYWQLKGLTVTEAGDNGIMVMGSNNTVEQCIAHHNNDTGIQVGVNKDVAGSGKDNLFLNCDSYQNNDTATNGENADGFGAKENSGGTGNMFRGCRAWDNADDGYDFYAWDSPITVDNCWAMSQAKSNAGGDSDGNGFKLGGNGVSAVHILKDLYATDNKYASSNCGFTNNNNPATMTCTGKCAAWDNETNTKNIGGVGTTAPGSATAAKMIAAQRKADGSLPDISSL